MSAPERIALVCFDLGGVLVRTCTAWPDLCRATGLDVRGASASDVAERARKELSDAHMRGDLSNEEWIAAAKKALGGLYTNEEIIALHDAVILDEYEGVGAVIDDLHRAGVATACLSNTNAAHWVALVHHDGERPLAGEPRYPALHKLGSHYASHLMRLIKPVPAIYRAFEEATGCPARAILFFDDRAENIEAARAAGWHAELIDPLAPTDAQLRRHLATHGVL